MTPLPFVVVLSATMLASAGLRPGAAVDAGQPGKGTKVLAIVVNRQNPIEKLTIAELRRILLGEVTRWPNGRKITVVMREPGQPERDAILRLVCRMSEREYTRHQLQATFVGELETGPKLLDTVIGVQRFIFNVPGAIGYVSADDVNDSVKTIRIEGAVAGKSAFGFGLGTP